MKKKFLLYGLVALSSLALASCGGSGDNPNGSVLESQPSSDTSVEIPSGSGSVEIPVVPQPSNSNTPLVLSSQEVDKVFNPFFSSSAPDSNVVGMTQLGMLSNDEFGKVVYGKNEATVVLDYEEVFDASAGEKGVTTYNFVLKNNVKFSNGSQLTIKDVLFNLYVYLDPVYTGSSTIYSTDIVGLQEYRTQQADENSQNKFMDQFYDEAETKIGDLAFISSEIFDSYDGATLTLDEFKAELADWEGDSIYGTLVEDFDKACELFEEELENDYANSIGTAQDIVFVNKNGIEYPNLLTTDVEAFLYNEGFITFDRDESVIVSELAPLSEVKTWTKEHAIDLIFNIKMPMNVEEVITYWATAENLNTYLVNKAMSDYSSDEDNIVFKNISGIKYANKDSMVVVNGNEYAVPQYDSNGNLISGNEVLSISINGVDPKAIWNFSFGVAPMYYYSDAEHIAKFDYVENFGVEYANQDWMTATVKNPNKIGVPVGAGAYKVSSASGNSNNVGSGDFYNKGVIYFERNEHFILGTPNIKYVRFQVVASNNLTNALYNNEVDFIQPNAKPETITDLNNKASQGIANKSITTNGYGYIGINAGKVPSRYVRQAIMHAINTNECVNYYGNTAKAIHRPMSTESWAYPEGATAYYPYIAGEIPANLNVVNPLYKEFVTNKGYSAGQVLSEDHQLEFISYLVCDLGEYTIGSNGILTDGTTTLKYTFTIAGQEKDHPAFGAMRTAADILNKIGFEITVSTDAQALRKLTTGDLAVWAAAWSTTIDPDMYQVYHMDSNATSVNNWGYKQILRAPEKYEYEYDKIVALSELIEQGRETTDQALRARIYASALDIVMELAIELPTYQREDLFAWNSNKINSSSLNQNTSPYSGLTSELWNVRLNEES